MITLVLLLKCNAIKTAFHDLQTGDPIGFQSIFCLQQYVSICSYRLILLILMLIEISKSEITMIPIPVFYRLFSYGITDCRL